MRTAPPVSVRACGGRRWLALRVALPALAAAACGTWILQWAEAGDAAALGAFLAIPVAIVAWRLADRREALLAWDGRCWTVDGCAGRLDLMIDLPGWLLMRLRPERREGSGATRWVAVTAAEAGADETLLRAALRAHAGAPLPADAADAPGAGGAREA